MKSQRIIQIEDKVLFNLLVPFNVWHMFVMFGASVLVPFIFGINPAMVLFANGVDALLSVGATRGKVSAYLESNSAPLASTGVIIGNFRYEYALGGSVVVGFCGHILTSIVYKFGIERIEVVLPPAAMGPVVALVRLELPGSTTSNAGLLNEVLDPRKIVVFVLTLGAVVFGPVPFRRFFSVIPILIAAIMSYAPALVCGIVNFAEVATAPVFVLPNFNTPKFNLKAIMIILPVPLVVTSEYIGHRVITSKIVGRNLLKDPGLYRPPFGGSFSAMISGLIGSVPTTTCGENIGTMTITRVYSVRATTGAAVLSIVCSPIGKFSTPISTIPDPVIGGVSFLLYDMIGTSGLRILMDSRVDYRNSRDLTLTSAIFITGLSGIAMKFGSMRLTGMMLACVVGMVLNLVFYALGYFKLISDR